MKRNERSELSGANGERRGRREGASKGREGEEKKDRGKGRK